MFVCSCVDPTLTCCICSMAESYRKPSCLKFREENIFSENAADRNCRKSCWRTFGEFGNEHKWIDENFPGVWKLMVKNWYCESESSHPSREKKSFWSLILTASLSPLWSIRLVVLLFMVTVIKFCEQISSSALVGCRCGAVEHLSLSPPVNGGISTKTNCDSVTRHFLTITNCRL